MKGGSGLEVTEKGIDIMLKGGGGKNGGLAAKGKGKGKGPPQLKGQGKGGGVGGIYKGGKAPSDSTAKGKGGRGKGSHGLQSSAPNVGILEAVRQQQIDAGVIIAEVCFHSPTPSRGR